MQPLGPELEDSIRPVRIEHGVFEDWKDGNLVQFYNFIDYDFEQSGAFIAARAYADNFEEISMSWPYENAEQLRRVEAPQFEAAVLSYLQRRFRAVRRTD